MNTKTKLDLTIEKKRNTNSFENINLTIIYKMLVWKINILSNYSIKNK